MENSDSVRVPNDVAERLRDAALHNRHYETLRELCQEGAREIDRLTAAPAPAAELVTSRIVELFGDRYDSETPNISGALLNDLYVAHQTAMLRRDDLCFEGVLATAKDRIRWLSRQREIQTARIKTLEAEVARLTPPPEAVLVIYKSVDGNVLWARPEEKFQDGRFEKCETS